MGSGDLTSTRLPTEVLATHSTRQISARDHAQPGRACGRTWRLAPGRPGSNLLVKLAMSISVGGARIRGLSPFEGFRPVFLWEQPAQASARLALRSCCALRTCAQCAPRHSHRQHGSGFGIPMLFPTRKRFGSRRVAWSGNVERQSCGHRWGAAAKLIVEIMSASQLHDDAYAVPALAGTVRPGTSHREARHGRRGAWV